MKRISVKQLVEQISAAKGHYEVLGVQPTARQKEIRHAYRQLSLRVHPDKVQSALGHDDSTFLKEAEAAFKLVLAAYELLSDEGRRAVYDHTRGYAKPDRGRGVQPRQPPPESQQQEPEAPFVFRTEKKKAPASKAPQQRETIVLTVVHAIFGDEVKLSMSKGMSVRWVKKTLSKLTKRGPPDRIELASPEGAYLNDDHVFISEQRVSGVGIRLGPPMAVTVQVRDTLTGVCRHIDVFDTCTVAQLEDRVAKVSGVPRKEVQLGQEVAKDDGPPSFQELDGSERLNGRHRLVMCGGSMGRLFLTPEEAARVQDDLIEAYSDESFQKKHRELSAQLRASTETAEGLEVQKLLSELLARAQRRCLFKWGFEGDGAVLQMCRAVGTWDDLPDVGQRGVRIVKLLAPPEDGADLPTKLRTKAAHKEDTKKEKKEERKEEPKAEPTEVHTEPYPWRVWRIVGGEDRGGLLVREGADLASFKTADRLSTGALVQELGRVPVEGAGDRLHFRRLTGTGPLEGWISVWLNHKYLAERIWITEEEVERLPKR